MLGRQFDELHNKLQPSDGGFSMNVQTGAEPPKVGYMVSIPGYEMRVRSPDVSPAHIKEFVEKHRAELDSADRYLGGWNNGKGEVTLDISDHIQPKQSVSDDYDDDVADADARTSALDLAVARNQEAVYDLRREDSAFNPYFKRPDTDA